MITIKSDKIRDHLTYIQTKVKNDTKQKMYGINETAENIFMHLLNDTFGDSFKNANDEEYNFPAIDLIDTKNRVVMQVTSDISTNKVRIETLEKFEKLVKKDKYKQYVNYKVKMFYINDKPNFSRKILQEFKEKGLPESHFLGIEDIIKKVSTDTNVGDRVYKRLSQIFDESSVQYKPPFVRQTRQGLEDKIKELTSSNTFEVNESLTSIETFEKEVKLSAERLSEKYFYLAYDTKDSVKAKDFFYKAVNYNHDYMLYAEVLFDEEFPKLEKFIELEEEVFPQVKVSNVSIYYSLKIIEKYMNNLEYEKAIKLSEKALHQNKNNSFSNQFYLNIKLQENLVFLYYDVEEKSKSEGMFSQVINQYYQIIDKQSEVYFELIEFFSKYNKYCTLQEETYQQFINYYQQFKISQKIDLNLLSNIENNLAIFCEEYNKVDYAVLLYQQAYMNRNNDFWQNIAFNFYLFYKRGRKYQESKQIIYNLLKLDKKYGFNVQETIFAQLNQYDQKSDINEIVKLCKELKKVQRDYSLNRQNVICQKYKDIIEIRNLHDKSVKYLKKLDNERINKKIETVLFLQDSNPTYKYLINFYDNKLKFLNIEIEENLKDKILLVALVVGILGVISLGWF